MCRPGSDRIPGFIIDELTAAPNVASVKTTLVIRRVKFEPGVPVALAQARKGGAIVETAEADHLMHTAHAAKLPPPPRSLFENNAHPRRCLVDPRGGRRVTDEIRARMVAALPALRRFA